MGCRMPTFVSRDDFPSIREHVGRPHTRCRALWHRGPEVADVLTTFPVPTNKKSGLGLWLSMLFDASLFPITFH